MLNGAVRDSAELERVLNLPRRKYDVSELDALARDLTPLLKREPGSMALRRLQALALHDIGVCGGGFCPIDVGGGKTLISFMAAHVLGARRPMLLLPAGLIQKTKNDREKLITDGWLIPTHVRLFSYEMLGRLQSSGILDVWAPDLIIADEVQKLKSEDAAVTRRVVRYMDAHPDTKFVALSGTIMDRSILEFAHILRWCLKGNAPIPLTNNDLAEWASALDDKVDELTRYEPGPLVRLATSDDAGDELTRARKGFRRRLIETPGVIASTEGGEHVGASIYVRAIQYPLKRTTIAHFARLRSEMLTPDDWQLTQPMEVWAHARELALGLTYAWDPHPPKVWRDRRREWCAFVRDVLARSNTLDSEAQVAAACDAGELPSDALTAWREVKDTFTPNVVPIWQDDGPLKVCAEWMRKPGIVWTEHALFAERLARETGAKYYGRKGLAEDGEFIDDADASRAIIASIDANREGRNLQTKWNRNLIVSPPERPGIWQQTLGRTHRPGQTADEVIVDVFLGCLEHANAWRRALSGAQAVRDTTGAEQKLLLADPDWPSDDEIAMWRDARWVAPPPPKFEIPTAA